MCSRELLERLELKWSLPGDVVQGISERMVRQEMADGDHVYDQGAVDNHLYVVDSGKVEVKMKIHVDGDSNDGVKEVTVKTLSRGDTSGFYSMLENRPHGATLVCRGHVTLYKLKREDFDALLAKYPNFSRGLLKSLSAKLQLVRKDYIGLTLQSDGAPTSPKVSQESDIGSLRICMFDAKPYWKPVVHEQLKRFPNLSISMKNTRLNEETAFLAAGHDAVCCFVNDKISEPVLFILGELGVRLILLRCAGFNNLNLQACDKLGITAARVPAYSPNAVAEHAVALIMALNRKVHVAYNRVRDGNFRLQGLCGFDMYGKTVGILGTGKIGRCFARIMHGFGCKILCYDVHQSLELEKYDCRYVSLDEVLAQSDIVSLHLPLNEDTDKIINSEKLAIMKQGSILINTSRGGLIHTGDLIDSLKNQHLGGAGLDVFENESGYFFEDWSNKTIVDDELTRLISFKNVIITSHQAFLTHEALGNIIGTTFENATEFLSGKRMHELTNSVNSSQLHQ